MDNISPPTGPSHDAFGREIHRHHIGSHRFDFMTSGADDLRPLVILQSLEYPGWPAPDFCNLAEDNGYRTICVRRPGFGPVPPVVDIERQVGMIAEFLQELERDDIVLTCFGTANTLAYRLAAHPKIALTVLGNCCFNHNPLAEIRPEWFARNVEQTLTSMTGARLALMGLKGAEGLFGKFWVTENFMQKSPGDLAYLENNRDLFSEAADSLLQGVDIHTFMMELRGTLNEDPFLQDGCFNYLSVVSVSGEETSDAWKSAIRAEAARVGVPLYFFPSGDALVIYASARRFMDLLRHYE